jgi:hypothetical protein
MVALSVLLLVRFVLRGLAQDQAAHVQELKRSGTHPCAFWTP